MNFSRTDVKLSELVPQEKRDRPSRLERDIARGYSINVKQVVLAFAVEFWIIGLIIVGTYLLIAESDRDHVSREAIFSALLLPAALAMVELARVPLAIAVRTQDTWHIKLFAVLGVVAAITVTTFSLSQIAWKTFDIRIAETVRLNEGAIVKLDPSSSVRIVGNLKVDVPQPSKQQLQLDTKAKTDELPFTNYTIFRDVSYEKGHVVTGWNYDLSDSTRPKVQYCYYQQSVEKGLSAKYTLAVNDSPRRPSALTKVSFNFDGALENCIWFSGY
jgi:hypothetical protein